MYYHISKSEQMKLVEDYKNSGLQVKCFCKKNKISSSAFYRWRAKYDPELISKQSVKFKPVKIINSDIKRPVASLESNTTAQIITSTGIKLIISESICPNNLVKILSSLGV